MVKRRIEFIVLAVLGLMLCAGSVAAQIPDKYTNLKVLPKDIDKRQMVDIMRSFSGALGVRCNYCHVGESTTSLEGFDFASDDKEKKRVARGMMQMVGEINDRLMPAAGLQSPMRVRCVTCHRGVEEPEMLTDILLEEAGKGGTATAEARYRELRKEYYGSGSYDFSPRTLNELAETLAREKNDVDGAIAFMKLNLEFNPDAAGSHLMLAQLYVTKGDNAAAVTAVEQALKLEPDNQRAKQMLERLRPTK